MLYNQVDMKRKIINTIAISSLVLIPISINSIKTVEEIENIKLMRQQRNLLDVMETDREMYVFDTDALP